MPARSPNPTDSGRPARYLPDGGRADATSPDADSTDAEDGRSDVGPAGVDMTDAHAGDASAAARKPSRRESPEARPDAAAGGCWVLVADEAIARLLEWPGPGHDLVQREVLTDAAARAKDEDLRRDQQGRRAAPVSNGAAEGTPHRGRAGMTSVTASAGEEPQHLEAAQFARRVARDLATAVQRHRIETLRIAAAPRFLGLLRRELDAHVKAVVAEELDKDLAHETEPMLSRRLFGDRARTRA